jgi:23S rRNA pseudouridine2605 synthase
MRIAKAMAHAGVCSRRDAEKMILEGKVAVNGTVIDTPALKVSDADTITVDGVALSKPEFPRLWLFHKPTGVITTHKDPQGRPTVFSLLPASLKHIVSVGRLDLNSEGLLLLTNNGGLAHHLESPETGWKRKYRVRVFGVVNEKALKDLKKGITIKDDNTGENIHYGPIEAEVDTRGTNRNAWLNITLTEGKNREIRKVCAHLGLQVNRLIRTSFGPFDLGKMKANELQEISKEHLKNQLGNIVEAL